jgi:hypothetical protein
MLSFDRIIGIDWSGSNSDWGVAEWGGGDILRPKLPDSMELTNDKLRAAVNLLRACPLPQTAQGKARKKFRETVDQALRHVDDENWQEVVKKGLGKNVSFGLGSFDGVDIPQDLFEAYLPIIKHARYKANSWRLPNIVQLLRDALDKNSKKRTLILVDAAVGYPSGFTEAVFGDDGWDVLLAKFGTYYDKLEHGTKPIDVAREINERLGEDGAPPVYALSDEWPNIAFYTKNRVSPFRLVDQLLVSAKSPLDFKQTTLGKVGGHTISCLSAISKLREDSSVSFSLWPQEVCDPEQLESSKEHVIAEVYPSILDAGETVPPDDITEHDIDARKAVAWAVESQTREMLRSAFDLSRFGLDDVWLKKVREEGWILGLNE